MSIIVTDKQTDQIVYRDDWESFGFVTGAMGDSDANNKARRLEQRYPPPRYEIEISVFKD